MTGEFAAGESSSKRDRNWWQRLRGETRTALPPEDPLQRQRRLLRIALAWPDRGGVRPEGIDQVPRLDLSYGKWAEVRAYIRDGGHRTTPMPLFSSGWLRRDGDPILYVLAPMKNQHQNSFPVTMSLAEVKRVWVLYEIFSTLSVRRTFWPQNRPISASTVAHHAHDTVVMNTGGIGPEPTLYLNSDGLDRATDALKLPPGRDTEHLADLFSAIQLAAAAIGTIQPHRVYSDPRTEQVIVDVHVRDGRIVTMELAAAAEERAAARKARRTPPPAPRLVRDAVEAEELAASWCRWLGQGHGFDTATRTPATGDGGVDVRGQHMVAQVKFEALKTGRPALQGLFGAGHGLGAKHWLFFSSAGYTQQAENWATSVGMALFRFALDGTIEPVNYVARKYWPDTE